MSSTAIVDVAAPPALSQLIPSEIAEILGDPPVLITEDRQAYDQLMAQLALEWKPRNINEWMFVRDIADISWEILRHRRAIAGVFAITFKKALATIASDVLRANRLDPGRLQANALAESWFKGADQREQVKSQLAKYGLDAQAIVAQTYILMADALDKLHRLLALAEARRTAVTRNFHEYRAMSHVKARLSMPKRSRSCRVLHDLVAALRWLPSNKSKQTGATPSVVPARAARSENHERAATPSAMACSRKYS